MNQNPVIFKNEDWELFCNANTLSQKAGVPKHKIGLLVAKELTDNALDVSGNVEIGYIEKDYSSCSFFVKNNGSGIPGSDKQIASLFSVKRPLLSTKKIRLPSRGALGNGLRVVTGAIISYGGSLEVATRGRILKLSPQETGETLFERIGKYDNNDTLIKIRINGSWSDPLDWGRLASCMTGGEHYKGKTSPYWYDSDSFYALLRSVQGNITIREFIAKNFDGCSGRKAGNIVSDDFSGRITSTITKEESNLILKKARLIAKEVKPNRLGYVGDIEGSIAYHTENHVFEMYSMKGGIKAKIPAIIEFWAFYEHEADNKFFVNRTPITGNVEVKFWEKHIYLSGCGLSCYINKKLRTYPTIWVNVITPYMPITTDGKEPDFHYLAGPIDQGIKKLINKVHKQLPKESKCKEKRSTVKDIVKNYLDDAIAKTSGNGQYRYSLRQLFYAIRPYVLDELGQEPDYNYFTAVITEIESETGEDLPNIYRDSRGTLLHPHLEDKMPLGTLSVENYRRPEYCFNKILYIEKEGFFEFLKDVKWAEMHDCALLSSKGFANRATRDLLDYLAKTEEEIEFFCIHDCDAPGTMIYQSLQEETKARKARNVKIIDLGLAPKEAQEMGLQVEKVKYGKKQKVADGYQEHEEWLQNNRIELNAMVTPIFIDWITKKITEHGKGKVIPSQDILKKEAIDKAREKLVEMVRRKIEAELKIEERIEREFRKLFPEVNAKLADIDILMNVKSRLAEHPVLNWRESVNNIVTSIVGGN